MLTSISSKKRVTRHIVEKTNSFVCFLEEFTTWQFAFEINWPLALIFLRPEASIQNAYFDTSWKTMYQINEDLNLAFRWKTMTARTRARNQISSNLSYWIFQIWIPFNFWQTFWMRSKSIKEFFKTRLRLLKFAIYLWYNKRIPYGALIFSLWP